MRDLAIALTGIALGAWLTYVAMRHLAPAGVSDPPPIGLHRAVWKVDTIRLPPDTIRLPPDTVRLLPMPRTQDTLRIDERADARLWLRIVDTLRGLQWRGRSVEYRWLGPVELRQVAVHLTQPAPPQSPWGSLMRPSPTARGRWGCMAGAGAQRWRGGAAASLSVGLRRDRLWIGAQAGMIWTPTQHRDPLPAAGLWAAWEIR